MPFRRESRIAQAGRWLLAFVVPASALAIGSLIPWVLVTMSVLAAVACTLLWIEPASRTSRAVPWALAAFLLLVITTAIQAIPLPAGVVAALAPTNADVWHRALTPFGEAGPAVHPLTVAPPATHIELLKGLLYTCVFLGALRIALMDGGGTFLERLVLVSACLVAFSTLGHPVTQADKVFGIYRPREGVGYMPGRIGPLLNPNHVAAYLNAGACVAAGAMFGRRKSLPRPLALGVVVLLAGTSVWAGSRGGMGSLVLGALLIAGFAFQQRRHESVIGRAEVAVVVVALVSAAVLLGVGSSEMARTEVEGSSDLTKLDIIWSATPLIPRAFFFGVGRGAYETVYPLVRADTAFYYTHLAPEDIIVQWLVEYGVPIAVAAFVLFAIALRPNVVLRAARPAIGAWVAILVVTLHDLVDFHLEVPGIVVLVVVCMAIVVGSRATGSEREHRPGAIALPRVIAFGAAAATVGAIILVVPHTDHSLREERERFAKLSVDPNVTSEEVRHELRKAILRYPNEPFFPLMGAVRAQRQGGESVIPWIARALETYPKFGRAHLVLARSLANRHRAQARLEYRLAYSYDAHLQSTIAKEAPFLVDDPDSAMELVPDGKYATVMLEALSDALANRLPATAAHLDEALLRIDPTARGPAKRRIRAAVSDLTHDHPWCADRARCVDDAVTAAQALITHDPAACEPRVMLAKLRIQAGEQTRGLDELMEGLDQVTDPACIRQVVALSLANGDRRHADLALNRALRSGCGTREECVSLYTWAAMTEESRGNNVNAVAFWKRVAEQAPDNDHPLERIAVLSSKLGLFQDAIEAYRTLSIRHPDEPKWRTLGDELRARSLRRPLPGVRDPLGGHDPQRTRDGR